MKSRAVRPPSCDPDCSLFSSRWPGAPCRRFAWRCGASERRRVNNLPLWPTCVLAILGAEERTEQALLANALRNDLQRKLAVGSNQIAVLLAEDANGDMAGCAAIEDAPSPHKRSPSSVSAGRVRSRH